MDLLPSQRHLFDIPEEVSYFNCAYNAPQLLESAERLTKGAELKRNIDSFFENAYTLRESCAHLFEGIRMALP